MKAIDAVENLRAMVDLLEKHGEAEIHMASTTVWFHKKESFLAFANDFPRPFTKEYEQGKHADLTVGHGTLAVNGHIQMKIGQSNICELVEPPRPAVYKCPALLSPEEEEEPEQA